MKKLYKYIVLVIGILALFSCAEEELVCSFGESESDVTLQLGVQTQNIKEVLVSRSEQNMEDYENTLYDLHIYVFDEGGLLTGYEQIDFGAKGYIHQPETPISIPVRTKTGNSYIYALANINSGDTYHLSDTELLRVTENNRPTLEAVYSESTDQTTNTTTKTLTGFTSLIDDNTLETKVGAKRMEDNQLSKDDDFLTMDFIRVYSSQQGQNFSPTPEDNRFMMSGYINQGGSVSIQRNADGSGYIYGDNDVIELYRILAKNTLTISSTDYGDGKFAFTPTSYRFWNVPKGGVLVPNVNITTTNAYLKDNITTADVESGYRLNTDETTITFYYPENLRVAKQGASITQWKDREKNTWNNGVKTYDNADAKAAYIEINGNYVSADGKTTADVTYTIHLGDFSATTGSISDFNVIRNSHYIYKVTVNGVEDIKVEAQRKVSGDNPNVPIDNPYAEGLIINATDGIHYEVDAHYEARVMTFKKSSITALKTREKGYILNILTPFGNTPQTLMVKHTTYNETEGDYICDLIGNPLAIINADGTFTKVSPDKILFDGEADYSWIRFVRNTTDNKPDYASDTDPISKYPCKYPGDGNETSDVNGEWINVFELLAELYDTDNNTNGEDATDVYKHSIINEDGTTDYVAYYTCFIDENYYPTKEWKDYASWHNTASDDPEAGRKKPRTMLIANNLAISEDGKSLYAEVEYSISQYPISSVYSNPNKMAFGTEIIDEEDVYSKRYSRDDLRLGSGTGNNKNPFYNNLQIKSPHHWNAYTSAVETIEDAGNNYNQWYAGDNVKSIDNVQPLYREVAKACMSRNRDTNGDGIIEANEIKWYLAAVGQYRALVFGQEALPSEVRLISTDELEEIDDANWGNDQNGHNFRGYYHYYTCSGSNAATFWPEEGITNNPAQNNWVSRAELVRCIRTLESNGNGQANPQVFYDFSDDNNKFIFTLDGITVFRNIISRPLGIHNEIEGSNELYSKFEVAKNDMTNTYSTSRIADCELTDDPCLSYSQETNASDRGTWRTPNQKEMALMLMYMNEENFPNSGSSFRPTYNANNLEARIYGTRTKFSGNDEGYYSWHNSPGFGSDNGSINLTDHTSAHIRCVRDIAINQ